MLTPNIKGVLDVGMHGVEFVQHVNYACVVLVVNDKYVIDIFVIVYYMVFFECVDGVVIL
jgi:hypothetical protein